MKEWDPGSSNTTAQTHRGRWPCGREPPVKRRSPFPETILLCFCSFIGPDRLGLRTWTLLQSTLGPGPGRFQFAGAELGRKVPENLRCPVRPPPTDPPHPWDGGKYCALRHYYKNIPWVCWWGKSYCSNGKAVQNNGGIYI